MKYLLDVNVLLAMSYEPHVHHVRVDQWLKQCRIIHGAALMLATSRIIHSRSTSPASLPKRSFAFRRRTTRRPREAAGYG